MNVKVFWFFKNNNIILEGGRYTIYLEPQFKAFNSCLLCISRTSRIVVKRI